MLVPKTPPPFCRLVPVPKTPIFGVVPVPKTPISYVPRHTPTSIYWECPPHTRSTCIYKHHLNQLNSQMSRSAISSWSKTMRYTNNYCNAYFCQAFHRKKYPALTGKIPKHIWWIEILIKINQSVCGIGHSVLCRTSNHQMARIQCMRCFRYIMLCRKKNSAIFIDKTTSLPSWEEPHLSIDMAKRSLNECLCVYKGLYFRQSVKWMSWGACKSKNGPSMNICSLRCQV